VWVLSALPVVVADLSDGNYAALLALDVNALVSLTGLPRLGAVPTLFMGWVEGWTERLEFGVHEIELAVSGYCRTTPAMLWDEMPTNMSWDQAHGMWNETYCWGPLTAFLPRWVDIPANQTWDETPDTWDTYKIGAA
jgi:hypothetical protein